MESVGLIDCLIFCAQIILIYIFLKKKFPLFSIRGLSQGRLQVCDGLAPDALGHDLRAILGHGTPIESY